MITVDFEAIASDDHVQAFVDKYGLKSCQVAKSVWNMGEWTGGVGTDAVHLGFRWYDPSCYGAGNFSAPGGVFFEKERNVIREKP